jgi:hypothetical protein
MSLQTAFMDHFNESDLLEILEEKDLVYDEVDDTIIDRDDSVYCQIEELTTHIDNTFYCDFSGNYFTTREYEAFEVEGFRNERYISSYYDDRLGNFNIVELHDGTYYNIEYCNYVEDESEWYHQDYTSYWESDGEYHLEPEPCGTLASYHGSNYADYSTEATVARIGFEIEKEDFSVLSEIDHIDLENIFGWGAEQDSSLNNDGFELVSPIFDLHTTNFEKVFKPLSYYIDGNYSDNCGGHINYSCDGYDAIQLFDAIKGYLPLLYAIYPTRLTKSYCQAKSCDSLKSDRDKYQSIRLRTNGVLEFRIFPAVKNVKNLIWRAELIRLIDRHKTDNFLQVIDYLLNPDHELSIHFSQIFSFEKIVSKVRTIIKMVERFEGVTIESNNLTEIENKVGEFIKTKKQ